LKKEVKVNNGSETTEGWRKVVILNGCNAARATESQADDVTEAGEANED